jgi:hypothetical protein
VQGLYEGMTERIDSVVRSGRVPEEIRVNHKGFSEWNTGANSKDHQPIVQVTFKLDIVFFFIFY